MKSYKTKIAFKDITNNNEYLLKCIDIVKDISEHHESKMISILKLLKMLATIYGNDEISRWQSAHYKQDDRYQFKNGYIDVCHIEDLYALTVNMYDLQVRIMNSKDEFTIAVYRWEQSDNPFDALRIYTKDSICNGVFVSEKSGDCTVIKESKLSDPIVIFHTDPTAAIYKPYLLFVDEKRKEKTRLALPVLDFSIATVFKSDDETVTDIVIYNDNNCNPTFNFPAKDIYY